MIQGFFDVPTGPITTGPRPPRCGACGLFKSCKSPKMPVTGEGRRKILICAECPGQREDDEGTQLIGKSGQRLRKSLAKFKVDLDRDCWKTNSVICKPSEGNPTDAQVDACRPNLDRAIRDLKPEVIILLGGAAVRSLIGPIWKQGEDVGKISKWVGWRIPSQRLNAWICPTWHPSYLLRENDPVLELWFDRHLERALELKGVPWPDGVPDYAASVECIYEPGKAAKILDRMVERGGMVAFDYETNMLKPDGPDAKIISCAVCWEGRKTIAYPWHGEAIKATSRMLLSNRIEKYGWNIKFEQRWTKAILGHGVRRWSLDGMVGSHLLDNRQGITSAKFQAFVTLGLDPYDVGIKPHLKADSGNEKNRIDHVDLKDLLIYNGIDARVEFEMGKRQREEMG